MKFKRDIKNWIVEITNEGDLPKNCQAILIGLYTSADGKYIIYFSGSTSFDRNNDDWACLEDEDYAPKNRYFYTEVYTSKNWKIFQNMVIDEIKAIIITEITILNQTHNIAIGFDDGNLIYL